MRIAICEDLQADTDRLCALLHRYCADNQLDVNIDCFTSGEALLEQFCAGNYQILFLDIFMDGMSGMDAARRVRGLDPDIAIILITTSREYAVDSYLVDAAFYIVKPVDHTSFALAMDRCRDLVRHHAKSLVVTQNREPVRVRLREILCLESRRNDCVLHTQREEVRTRAQLSALEPELGGLPFLRCHRSFIVNLHWVADLVGRDFVLQNGMKIPISRAHHTAAHQEFRRFLIANARADEEPGSI